MKFLLITLTLGLVACLTLAAPVESEVSAVENAGVAAPEELIRAKKSADVSIKANFYT